MSDDNLLHDFSGVARLFPLPNLVMFPHVIQPLHIFEPRYRQLMEDALTGDRLIAVVLLKPGWEEDYESRPAIHDVACLGRVLNEEKLPDGKYNLLLSGVCRVRLDQEVPDTKLYRSAQCWPLPDAQQPDIPKLRSRLLEEARRWLPKHSHLADQFQKILASKLPLGAVCDILGFALPLSVEVKQALLEELDIEQRARRLVHELKSGTPPEVLHMPKLSRYPPEFSAN